jgi:murein DD-endopeptidase MepM/ murein hydrolase activator NlpD
VNTTRKTITIYFYTADESKTRRFVIPVAYFKVSAFFLGLLFLIFLTGFIDYFGLLAQSLENKKLKVENLNLKKQFQVVEGKLDGLQSALDRVSNISNKLRLITDTKLSDRAEKLSFPARQVVGNQTETAQVNPRLTPQELDQADTYVTQELTLNPLKGEMASEESESSYSTLVIRIDEAIKDSNLKEQSVIELWELLSDRQSLLAATPSMKPSRGPIGSRFGFRVDPFNGKQRMHAGLDIVASPGTPVRSPADGVVSFSGWDDQYGKLVSIDHGYGVLTRYGHNSQLYVQVGQKVTKYDVISAVGSTGRSTGPHLHYEVRINGIPVDPANYILDEDN